MSPLLPLFLTIFVDVFGLTLVIPLLAYYAQRFGASPLQVGLLGASYAAMQLFASPILGAISDRVGRKKTLLFSQIGTFAGFAVLAGASSLGMLFAGRMITGATAGNLTIAQAYISDVTPPEKRTRTFAIIGIAFGFGFLFGPPTSGLLAERFGYGAPPLVAAALSALSALITLTRLPDLRPSPPDAGAPPPPRRTLSFGPFLALPAARQRLLQYLCYGLSFSTLMGGVPLYLGAQFHYDVRQTGYVFAYTGLVGALIQGGLIRRLVAALGEEKLVALGLLTMMAHAALGWLYTLPPLLVVTAIGGIGISVVRPSLTTLITRSVPPDQQGAALGVSQSLASVGQIVGPISAGALIGRGWIAGFGLASAAWALLGLLLQAAAPSDKPTKPMSPAV